MFICSSQRGTVSTPGHGKLESEAVHLFFPIIEVVVKESTDAVWAELFYFGYMTEADMRFIVCSELKTAFIVLWK